MAESIKRIYFPLLPFDQDIPFFEQFINFDQIQIPEEISSNDSSDTEPELKTDGNNTNNICTFHPNVINKSHQKSPVIMNDATANFKYSFYKIFTSRKKFPKKYVVSIHNSICDQLNLRKVSRDEARSIHLHFVNFVMYAEQILMFIQKNKNIIIQNNPGLKDILK